MNENSDFPNLEESDPLTSRLIQKSKKSKQRFQKILLGMKLIVCLLVGWCIYLGLTEQYEKLYNVILVTAAFCGLFMKGYMYARALDDL